MKTVAILIVDDDPALLQALPQAVSLRIPGIQVDTADSALEALTKLKECEYDAIVSDIKMPGMDGLALLAKIKELWPQTPTLLITGHGDHDLAIQALRGGAYDFIQKPIDRDYFTAALKRAIQTHQLHLQVRQQRQALEDHALSLEQQVEERTRELVAANASKDEFISVISHELKTPLTSLKAMVQLLIRRQERTGNYNHSELKSMERAVRRMEVLVQDLLNATQLEYGFFELYRTDCELNTLCKSVIDEYVGMSDPSLTFEPYNEPLQVEVDVERISQVLLNILSNARKYSPKGALVVVSIRREGDQAIIAIRDQGTGIPAEVLPHLFERFYRVPGIEVQSGSSIGLGLGLYIAKKIIEDHQGKIEVESTPGQGSIFSIVLPLVVGESLASAP